MQITVNGVSRAVDEGTALVALLEGLGLKPASTVIERNGVVLERARIPDTIIADGDVLEFVRFVGGG
jgi:sulfur carrier protein